MSDTVLGVSPSQAQNIWISDIFDSICWCKVGRQVDQVMSRGQTISGNFLPRRKCGNHCVEDFQWGQQCDRGVAALTGVMMRPEVEVAPEVWDWGVATGGPGEENQSLSTIQHHRPIIQHLCVILWLKKTNAHHHSNHASPHSRDTSSPDPGVASFTKEGAGGSTALVQLSHGALIPRHQVSTRYSTARYQV